MILVISIFLTKENFSKMAVLRYFEKAMVQIFVIKPSLGRVEIPSRQIGTFESIFHSPKLGI